MADIFTVQAWIAAGRRYGLALFVLCRLTGVTAVSRMHAGAFSGADPTAAIVRAIPFARRNERIVAEDAALAALLGFSIAPVLLNAGQIRVLSHEAPAFSADPLHR